MTPISLFADAVAVGEAVAGRIAALVDGGHAVLGVPAGRTPLPAFRAFARRAPALDLSRLHIVMMDEYLERSPAGWRLCPRTAHYSCRAFAERHIAQAWGLDASQVHGPDPADPAAYDREIAALGGVDLFLIASGASDGHVAFNRPGTPLTQATAITELALETRKDNLGTFPSFTGLQEVPTHGVGVGPATIAAARAAILILTGEGKREAYRRINAVTAYDPAWPATVIHACPNAEIFADTAASSA